VDKHTKKKQLFPRDETPAEAERRRVGTVVHDDRGNASVRWRDAPADYQRPVLEVLGETPLAIKSDETFDPYSRHRADDKMDSAKTRTRTDLRKLSEHIKKMRELEARKRADGEEEEG
jgi:hypothetical protein